MLRQVAPRLLVYGYGHRDSPRLQTVLSAAITSAAASAPATAAAAIDALVEAERVLQASSKAGFVALEESPPLLVSVLARSGAAMGTAGWEGITAAARGFRAIVERAQVSRAYGVGPNPLGHRAARPGEQGLGLVTYNLPGHCGARPGEQSTCAQGSGHDRDCGSCPAL